MPYKLGRLSAPHDDRNFLAAKYMTELAPPPPTCDYMTKVPQWPLYLNAGDGAVGDCTIASSAHQIGGWTYNAQGAEVILAGADILQAYHDVSGYTPDDPASDKGAVLPAVLKYWRKVGIGGHKIYAFVEVDHDNLTEVKQAINTFGSVHVGVDLPRSAKAQVGEMVWDLVEGPEGEAGSWGGHAIDVAAYSEDSFTCATWGLLQKMTNAFWSAYVVEAFAIISMDWFKDGVTPLGFDLTALQSDLATLAVPIIENRNRGCLSRFGLA